MSAPLFIRTPRLFGAIVGGVLYVSGTPTLIAANGEVPTLLIETIRYCYPLAPFGGRTAGVVEIYLLSPTADLVLLESHATPAMAESEIVAPVTIQLDVALPTGWSLQFSTTADDIVAGVAALAQVLVAGGELG